MRERGWDEVCAGVGACEGGMAIMGVRRHGVVEGIVPCFVVGDLVGAGALDMRLHSSGVWNGVCWCLDAVVAFAKFERR